MRINVRRTQKEDLVLQLRHEKSKFHELHEEIESYLDEEAKIKMG